MDFVIMLVKLVFAMVVVLGLMYLTFKVSGEKLEQVNKNKNMQILDRLQISRESAITIVKILDRGYILSTSNKGCEKLDELSKEELNLIILEKEKLKNQARGNYEVLMNKVLSKVPSKKYLKKKEDKNET